MADRFCLDPDKIRPSRHQTLAHQYESWGDVRADLIRRTGLERQETRIAHPRHMFFFNLKGVARRGEDFVDGRRVSFSARRPGSIIYIPAESEWTGWDEGDAIASYLLVSIAREFAEQTFEGSASYRSAQMPPWIGFRDNTIEMALQRIAAELRYPDPISVTMVESQVTQLFVQMVRLNQTGHQVAKGGLSTFDLKRVLGMIEASSDGRPTLTQLAEELGISRFHFSRAFKQSTGMTPHAFIAQRRLEQSADLLRSTNLSATQIALECGFASSSHFTTAFKRGFGTNPIEFRRKCRI
ncbi:AraC family transcriptional regulator [Mesorhizobium hawassense]|uniref:AraC family transcriptional regulator n=1 Tax=Mesorhizobium hawassense TaxID=1209954 RepID=A0A330HNZ3_9HYPH|nr:helix-turn-helix transcriptional regulator [Mesorhizobium hawassense]RAZ89428.1 AraC family transcriptional regulator [Mesorhizobium hawassense]